MFSFSDIDECVSESSPYSLHKDCFNTVGSYMCNCKSGFIPSGPYCIGKNLQSCHASPQISAISSNCR